MQKNINTQIRKLKEFKQKFLDSSLRIMQAGDSKLFALDFLALSVNNRAISLLEGYIILVKNKNFLTAITLVRLQLDNALRFFASTLVNDTHDFANHFINGKSIKDYKDANGEKLNDGYLAKKLDEYFPGTQKLYNEACSYIHLSDKHFTPTLTKPNTEHGKVGVVIGSSENFAIEKKFEFNETMLEVCKLVLIVVEQWKHEKEKISKIHDELNHDK